MRAEEVALVDVGGGDLLRRVEPVQGPDVVAQGGRLLEPRLLGRLHHLGLEALHHLVRAPFQEQPRVLRRLPVAVEGADLGHAGGEAALDLVLQARPRAPPVERLLAGADAEDAVDHGGGLAPEPGRDVRSAVRVCVLGHPPHHVQPGVLLGQGELQVGMVLVVAEEDVEAGLVALDEVVLEGQRLHLRVREHEVEVGDLGDHVAALGVDGPRGLEVRAHAVAQHAGLAHVEDVALRVLEHVHAGTHGQRLELLRQAHLNAPSPHAPFPAAGARTYYTIRRFPARSRHDHAAHR